MVHGRLESLTYLVVRVRLESLTYLVVRVRLKSLTYLVATSSMPQTKGEVQHSGNRLPTGTRDPHETTEKKQRVRW